MITMTAQIDTYDGYFAFEDQNATQAIASIRAHKMIDAISTDEQRVQIPYTSVLAAYFFTEQSESDIEDANCKVRTPEADEKPDGGDTEPDGGDVEPVGPPTE